MALHMDLTYSYHTFLATVLAPWSGTNGLSYLVLRREWGNGLRGLVLYYWELYRDYYRDPFSHFLLSTREIGFLAVFFLTVA